MKRYIEPQGNALAVGQQPGLDGAYHDPKGHESRGGPKVAPPEFRRAVCVAVEIDQHKPGTMASSRVEARQPFQQPRLALRPMDGGDLDADEVEQPLEDGLIHDPFHSAGHEHRHEPNRRTS
jgi:hypothetical protein